MAENRKPIIGIAGLTGYTEPGMFISAERVFTGSTNVRAIMKNGGIPVLLPAAALAEDVEGVMAGCDGLLVPGGEDMTPWYYKEEPLPVIGTFRPEIDKAWLNAVKYAAAHKKPVLGICKGHQTINVAMGGSLYQDMSLQVEANGCPVIQHMQKYNRTYLTHHVEVEEGTRLAAILGAGPLETNSMHHQAVKELGKGLRVSARACDGTIEAIEDEEGILLGTQWHPEDLVDTAPIMNRLFADLVKRCQERF
ncbi:MAG: gamma-glutamyl-gamma-aminobutyrate hydrolase family protein [Lachnospiraceae bacterium]|nr:gamma-glutamyl-gamma-aminobutyrate hydrolase family protein [Lachnospiraceae bacterium]